MLWFVSLFSCDSPIINQVHLFQITDYYVIRKGHYRVKDLYSPKKDGWYYYTYGVNFRYGLRPVISEYSSHIHNYRAYAAYIAGILINVVGFAGASKFVLLYPTNMDSNNICKL